MRQLRRLTAGLLVVAGCSGAADPAPTSLPGTVAPATTGAATTQAPDSTAPTVTAAPATTAAPASTTTTTLPAPTDPLLGLGLERIRAEELTQPTVIASRPGDAERLYIGERSGTIRTVDPDGSIATFGDLSDRVSWADGIEKGFLGLAFHPDDGGLLYTYYVNLDGQRQVTEYRVDPDDPDRLDPDSARVLFARDQPPDSSDIRHYAGMLAFGPDGMLYVSSGDGADARGQGQNPDTIFGTILRIDVDGGDPYGIPDDNPFVAGGGAPEVWAYGLRNPWRFAIDPVQQLVFIADVGQEHWEEINVVPLDQPGANFGWPDTEGARCFLLSGCDLDDYTLPAVEYSHDEGCSVTGGVVYQGSAIPEMRGHFFYADWCGQWVRSFSYWDGEALNHADWSADLDGIGQVNSFGTGPDGEMYAANFAGDLFRIVPRR